MKKACIFVVTAVLLVAHSAMADSIAGKFGVAVRGGSTTLADSKFVDGEKINFDTGWNVGGGIIYGINDTIAVDSDVIYFQSDANVTGVNVGTAKTTDISLGVQYRFMPTKTVVPYVGAGIDVLINAFSFNSNISAPSSVDVDTTFGGHLSAGVDYFIAKNMALNVELRGLLSNEADVKDKTGFVGAKYDPSNFTALFGVKIFFQ